MNVVGELSFSVENFSSVYDEATPLMKQHWHEIAKNKEVMILDPDREKYEKVNAAGMLLLVTARLNRTLAGYFLWLMSPHMHYRHLLTAEEDLHYLAPEMRKGLAGYQFVRAACDHAIARGARMLIMREKIGHEHPALMARLGFIATDVSYRLVVENPCGT